MSKTDSSFDFQLSQPLRFSSVSLSSPLAFSTIKSDFHDFDSADTTFTYQHTRDTGLGKATAGPSKRRKIVTLKVGTYTASHASTSPSIGDSIQARASAKPILALEDSDQSLSKPTYGCRPCPNPNMATGLQNTQAGSFGNSMQAQKCAQQGVKPEPKTSISVLGSCELKKYLNKWEAQLVYCRYDLQLPSIKGTDEEYKVTEQFEELTFFVSLAHPVFHLAAIGSWPAETLGNDDYADEDVYRFIDVENVNHHLDHCIRKERALERMLNDPARNISSIDDTKLDKHIAELTFRIKLLTPLAKGLLVKCGRPEVDLSDAE